MKLNLFLVFITLGSSYGQILNVNQNNNNDQQESLEQLFRPLPGLEQSMEPMLKSIIENQNPFDSPFFKDKSPFERFHKLFDKMPKTTKEDKRFRWTPFQNRPFFTSDAIMMRTHDKPLKTVSEVKRKVSIEKHGSGFPVFHPKKSEMSDLSPIISSIIDSNKPMMIDFNNKANDNKNLTINVDWNIRDTDLEDNKSTLMTNYSTKMVYNDPSIPPIKKIMDDIFGSFPMFRNLLKDAFSDDKKPNENANQTSKTVITSDQTTKSAIKSEPTRKTVIMVGCKCPEHKHEDNCPNNEKHLKESLITKAPKMSSTEKNTLRIDSMKDLENMINDQKLSEDYRADELISVKELDKSELNIKEKENEYYWYDFLLISSISGTSLLLSLMAIILIVKRCRSGQKDNKESNMKVAIDIHKNEVNETLNQEKLIL